MCPMKFKLKHHLSRHKRIHTGEKPYKCRFCEWSCTQSSDLVVHTRTHVGENTYECNECECSFRYATQLKAHKRYHFLEQQNNSNLEDINDHQEDI